METVFIGNQASNIGKTATIMSLAACLSRFGFKVLVVDLSGDVTSMLCDNIPENTIVDVLIGTLSAPDAIIHLESYDILPAPSSTKLFDCNLPLTNCIESKFILSASLHEQTRYNLSEKYDFILIDALRDTIAIESAAVASDSIILPCSLSPYSLYGVERLLYQINEIEQACGIATRVDGFVFTGYNAKLATHREMYQEFLNVSKEKNIDYYRTLLRQSDVVERAMYEKKSIITYERGNGRKDALAFTLEFLERRGLTPRRNWPKYR